MQAVLRRAHAEGHTDLLEAASINAARELGATVWAEGVEDVDHRGKLAVALGREISSAAHPRTRRVILRPTLL